jgi:hypothetical protein
LLGTGVVPNYASTPSGFTTEQQRLRDATTANNRNNLDVAGVNNAGALERTRVQEAGASSRNDASIAGTLAGVDKNNAGQMDRLRVQEDGLTTRGNANNAAEMDRLQVQEQGLTSRNNANNVKDVEVAGMNNEGALSRTIAGEDGAMARTKVTEGGAMDRLKYATENGVTVNGRGQLGKPGAALDVSPNEVRQLQDAVLLSLATLYPEIPPEQMDPGVLNAITTRAAEIYQQTRNASVAVQQAIKEVATESYSVDESWLPTGDTQRVRIAPSPAGAPAPAENPAPGGSPTPGAGADPLDGRTATGPNGMKIIRRNGAWYDVKTGQMVQ